MQHYEHPILIRGHYQIVALSDDATYKPDNVVGYAIVSSSGVRLRHELRLEDAKMWMEKLIEEELAQRRERNELTR
ncbi:MAG: hypothetical protein LBL59_09145 [Xanthomonadaceae bacterium]|jgi:hypothetical protein|nr:hypothetical protein [Xanthomonadaceae bacterium]